jgi:pyruvate-ferredoxin/flavodoxin oxidoreductase
LPHEWRAALVAKRLKLFVIDANRVAGEIGMGRRTNTILQTCFFALSGVLPREEAITAIKHAIEKTYARKGEAVVRLNFAAVDAALAGLAEVVIPEIIDVAEAMAVTPARLVERPQFVESVTMRLLAGEGDALPVSALPEDGVWPTGTSCYEKRGIAQEIPTWDPSICIQCNKCVLVCPHAAIRAKFYDPAELEGAPDGFQSTVFKAREYPGKHYTLQVAPEDCTGCTLCVQVCPAKDKTNPRHKAIDMTPLEPVLEAERPRWDFFLDLPDPDRTTLTSDVKGSQFMRPLMEFSGACAGCGETPYLKLLTQLFGDRLVMANATGCSSIYGGNLPTTPYTKDGNGRGPAWANSLFEDNAEFGMGLRLALDHHAATARQLVRELAPQLGDERAKALLEAEQGTETGIAAQRARVAALRPDLAGLKTPAAAQLAAVADHLVNKSLWIIGGDGWAYDIGYGGLDHVLASGINVKVLVLDTEVYSNTGGQSSKSTPMGAVAKFAAGGKGVGKKDLALMAMQYGHVYVARVALDAKDSQTVLAMREAEAWPGPALIIAYSPCIAHGYPLHLAPAQTKLAVESGYWPLFRNDPRAVAAGGAAIKLDSLPPKADVAQFMAGETRFDLLQRIDPARAEMLTAQARARIIHDQAWLNRLAQPPVTQTSS